MSSCLLRDESPWESLQIFMLSAGCIRWSADFSFWTFEKIDTCGFEWNASANIGRSAVKFGMSSTGGVVITLLIPSAFLLAPLRGWKRLSCWKNSHEVWRRRFSSALRMNYNPTFWWTATIGSKCPGFFGQIPSKLYLSHQPQLYCAQCLLANVRIFIC